MSSDVLYESETVELKKSLAELKEGPISMAAMLNKHRRGELWFGVAPNGQSVGLEISEKTLRDVSQTIGTHIEPRIYPHIQAQIVNGKPCVHIAFDGQEAPYFAYVNAFCHRDWRDPDYVQVAIFKDRVEIRNPGKLYGGLTIEDLHRGNVSRRRNPLIADLFRRVEMVEAWGRGMTLIHTNAPAVSFREVAGLFIASFARPSFSFNGQETAEQTVDKTVDKPRLSAREIALCELVTRQPQITQKELAEQLGLTERGVRYLTDKLQKQSVLVRQGGKKQGTWVLLVEARDE